MDKCRDSVHIRLKRHRGAVTHPMTNHRSMEDRMAAAKLAKLLPHFHLYTCPDMLYIEACQ